MVGKLVVSIHAQFKVGTLGHSLEVIIGALDELGDSCETNPSSQVRLAVGEVIVDLLLKEMSKTKQ